MAVVGDHHRLDRLAEHLRHLHILHHAVRPQLRLCQVRAMAGGLLHGFLPECHHHGTGESRHNGRRAWPSIWPTRGT